MKLNHIIKLILLTQTLAYSYVFAQSQVVVEEVMFMDAPYVGEVNTTTKKYAADGLFREEAEVKVDRFLIRIAMGGNKIIGIVGFPGWGRPEVVLVLAPIYARIQCPGK